MLIGKTSFKRMREKVGINRASKKTLIAINDIALAHLKKLVHCAKVITIFSGRKTITDTDFAIISQFIPDTPAFIFCGAGAITNLKPFISAIRNELDQDLRISKTVGPVVQGLVEDHLFKILRKVSAVMSNTQCETLLSRHLNSPQ